MSISRTANPLQTEALHASTTAVDVPNYDRAALCRSIVHIGVGGFHRAHMAVYVDEAGHTSHTATLGAAGDIEPELADWIGQHIAFPNGMVDRITPATTGTDRDWLAEHHGIADHRPTADGGFLVLVGPSGSGKIEGGVPVCWPDGLRLATEDEAAA